MLFASLALLSLLHGPEVAISNPAYVPVGGRAQAAAIASSGDDFVIFWTESTTGREGLYASRISSVGEVTAVGLQVRTGGNVTDVSVCWTGSAYVVTWTDARAGGVMIAAIDATATIRLIPPRLLIGPVSTFSDALAWSGSRALLACRWGPASEIRGTLIDATGAVVMADTGVLTRAQYPSVHVVSRNGMFALFWIDNAQPHPNAPLQPAIVARRVSENGQAIDAQSSVIGIASSDFAVAAGTPGYAAVTIDDAGLLRRYRIDSSLQPSELPSVPVASNRAGVLWDGRDFVVDWIDSGFHTQGLGEAERHTIAIAGASHPLLAWNGSQYFAAWTNGTNPAGNIAGGDVTTAILDSDRSSVLHSLPVTQPAGWQSAPRIVHVGNVSLVVWSEKVSEVATNQVGVRIGPSGRWLDPEPLLIAEKAAAASVVTAGSDFLVVYAHEDAAGPGLYFRRIPASGAMAESTRIASGYSPVAASNGTIALVAFFAGSDIKGVRIRDGATVDVVPLSIAGFGLPSSVASNGTDFLVVWNEGTDFAPGGIFYFPNLIDVYATRVSASGVPDVPIAVATGPKDQKDGIAASDGRDYLIAYFTGDLGQERRLAAKRILREGVLAAGTSMDDGQILGDANEYDTTSVVPFEDGYLIAWETAARANTFLRVIKTDRDGAPEGDADPIAESGSPYFQMQPSMTSFGSGVQLAYGRFDRVMRVYVRALSAVQGKRRIASPAP
jgi:hypothetical protein